MTTTTTTTTATRATRTRKYDYLHVVQGNYGYGHGWEDVAASEDRREARADLRAYRENAPEYRYRLIQRREPRTDSNAN